MRKFIFPLVFLATTVLWLGANCLTVKAASYDGMYQVSDYHQTCEPPIDLQAGFSVTENKFVNLWGEDGNIASDGTGTMRMNYGSDEYMDLTYTFSQSGSELRVDLTWTAVGYEGKHCSGSLVGTATSLFGGLDFGGLSGLFDQSYILYAILFGVGGFAIFVVILIAIIKLLTKKPPLVNPPVQTPPVTPEAPETQQTVWGTPPVQQGQPLNVPPAPETGHVQAPPPKEYVATRPVYGKKIKPKKKGHIWPELKRKAPKN